MVGAITQTTEAGASTGGAQSISRRKGAITEVEPSKVTIAATLPSQDF